MDGCVDRWSPLDAAGNGPLMAHRSVQNGRPTPLDTTVAVRTAIHRWCPICAGQPRQAHTHGVSNFLVTPWWQRLCDGPTPDAGLPGGVAQTPILAWRSAQVQELIGLVDANATDGEKLRQVHAIVQASIRPVYALDDLQSVAVTARRGRGSCSQRLALVEAAARGMGIATRTHGVFVNGRFWYPRFHRVKPLVPDVIVLAWPEFLMDGAWLEVSDLFGRDSCALDAAVPFDNAGGETLFDAVARTKIDWFGTATPPSDCDVTNLSAFVRADLGFFNDRDDLFARHGQTLCGGALHIAEPLMSHWSAGAGVAA
jgi:hypothetical protein